MKRIPVICILSPGHSGSTLLDLLLSSHSRITGVGELKVLSERKRRTSRWRTFRERECACRRRLACCEFWQEIDERLQQKAGRTLGDLDTVSRDPVTTCEDTALVLEAVRSSTGCLYVVDSSKTVERVELFLRSDLFDVRAIHLVRSPYGVVYSDVKRGRSWLACAAKYWHRHRRILRALRGVEHFRVSYEDLARNHERVIGDLIIRLDPRDD